MSTSPHALTRAEWEEIGSLEAVRQSWDVEDGEGFADLAEEAIHGARFEFASGSPGYCGDLYILHGDTVGNPPLVLIRDETGGIAICD